MRLRSSSSSPKAASTASISPENRKQTQGKPLKSISEVTESDENISGGDAVILTMKEHMKNSCSENRGTKKKKLTWRKRMKKKNLVSLKIHQNPNSRSDWLHTNKTLDVYHNLSFNDIIRPKDSDNYSLILNDMESTIPSNSFKSGSSSINIPSISVPENFVVTKADSKLKQNSKSFDTSEESNATSLLTHSNLNSAEVNNCDFPKNVDSASYVSKLNKSHMVVSNSEKCFISPDKNISIGQKSSSIDRHEAESHELPSSQQKSIDDVSLLSKGNIVDILEVKSNAITVLCDENQSAEHNNVSNLQADSSSHSVLPQVDNLIHVGKNHDTENGYLFDTLSSDSKSWEDFKRRPTDQKQNIPLIDLDEQSQEKSPKVIQKLLPANHKLINKNILSHIRGKELNRFVRSNKNAEAPKQRRSTKLRQTNGSSDSVIEESVECNEGINSLTKSSENSDTLMDLTSDEGQDNNHFMFTDVFNQASSYTKVKSKILIPCETKEGKSTTRHSATTKGSIKEPKNYKTPAVRGRKSKNIKERLNNCSSETLTDVECYNQGMSDDDKRYENSMVSNVKENCKFIEKNDKMFHQEKKRNMVDKFLDSNTKSQKHTNSKVTCNKKLQKLTNSIDSSGAGKQKSHNIPTEVKKRNHYSSSSDDENLHSKSVSIAKKNCSGLAIDDTKCQNIPTDVEKINHSSSSPDDEKLNCSSSVKKNCDVSAIVDTKCHDIPTEVEKRNHNSSSSDNEKLHSSSAPFVKKNCNVSAKDAMKGHKIPTKVGKRNHNSSSSDNEKLHSSSASIVKRHCNVSAKDVIKCHNIPTKVKKRNHNLSSSDNEKLNCSSSSVVKKNFNVSAIGDTKCLNLPSDVKERNHNLSPSDNEEHSNSSASFVKNNINLSAKDDTKCLNIPTKVEKRNHNSSSSDNGLHNSLPANDRKKISASASVDKKICPKSTTRGIEKIVKTSVTGGRKKPKWPAVRNKGSQNPRTGRAMKSHYSKGIDKYSIPKISKSLPTCKDTEKHSPTFHHEDTSKSAPLSHTNKQNYSPEKKEHTFVKMTVPSFSDDEVSVVTNNNWTNKKIPLLSNINETVFSSEKKMVLKEGEHEATTNRVKPLNSINSSKNSPFENFPDKSFDNSSISKQSTKSSDINIEKFKAIPLVNKDSRNTKRDTKHSSKRSQLLPTTYVSDSHFEKPGSLEGIFEEIYSKKKNENKDSSLHNKIGTSQDMVPNKIASPNPLKTVYNFEWYKKSYCNNYTQDSGPKKPSPQETSGIKESYEEKSTHITEFTQSLCPPQFQNGKNVNLITDDKYINSNSEKTNELNYQDCSVQENMDKNLKLFEMITSNTNDQLGLSKKDENMIKPVDRSFKNQNSYLFISSDWKEKEKETDGCGSDFAFPKYQSDKLDSVNNRNLTLNSPELTIAWEENEEMMFSDEDHSDLSSRKKSFAYSNSNHDNINNGEGFHHDASKTLVKGAMEEGGKLQNSTDSTSIKNRLDHSKVEDNFQHDSSGERSLSNTSVGQNKVFLHHKELSDANDKDSISSASFTDLQSSENNKKHSQKPTDSKQMYDDNLFSEELFKKYFRPNYCIRKILDNYCPYKTSCRKNYHSIREDFFYTIKKEEIGILVRTVFKKSKRITPSFLSALLNFFGRHAAITPILSLSKRFLCKEFLNNTRKPNQSYFIQVSASFFSALKACGFLRPRDMLEELVKYNTKFFSVCDLEKILFILEHWNIASPFLSPVWPILKPLANIKGLLLSAKILSKLFDEAISSSDCDLLTFVANQLLLLPVERLDIFKKKELKNFILKMIDAGLSTEAKSLSKLIPDYYSVEDIFRNKPLKTKARPLSDVSSKIVHISQECGTRCPTEFDRKGTQYVPWLDQKESSNTNMNDLLQEAKVAIKCAVESENYYRLSLTVIKYSEQGIGKAVLSYVFNFFNEKEPLVMTESLITELSKVAEYEKYKLFCGSLLSSFVVYFAEEGMWEVSRGFLLSFEKFCIDKYRVKNIYEDLSPIRLIFIYSEVYFHNNCYKASVEEIIQNDVLKNVKKNVYNDDEVFAQQIIESFLQEYIKLKETSIGVQLFSYILDSNFKRIDLTEYFEEIINQVFQNSPLDETPLNLYISLSQKADVKLFGLTIRVLLIIAYRLKKWSTVEDLFKRGLDEGCYPCPEAKEYSIKLLKSFTKEEIFCYVSEWCLNFKKRLHQGSRTTHLNLSADKNSILKVNRHISVSFKEEGLADYISSSSCGTPALLKDIDESFEGSMARLVSALKSFNFNILGVINKTLIIDFESVINLLKQT